MPEVRIPTLAELRDEHGHLVPSEFLEEAETRHQSALAAIDTEAAGQPLTAAQQRRWDAHQLAVSELRQADAEQRAERLRESRARNASTRFDPADTLPAASGSALRSAALRHAEQAVKQGMLAPAGAETIEHLMSGRDGSVATEWAATAGSPDYLRAFAKIVANPTHGHLEWTPAEQDAFRAVQQARRGRAERTALVAAGYVLPTSLDPAVMLTSAGSNNPLRQVARTVQTATSTWRGITSAGATAEWKAEGAQAADGTPAAAEVQIPTFMADVDVIYSYEVEQDSLDLVSQLQMLAIDALDNLQATSFTTGNGTTAPQGFITGLAGTASEINSGGTEVLAAADPYTLQNALPARFSAGASWLSHIATANTLRQFETANGALKFPSLHDDPPMLLGKPWNECSNMDSIINAAATENNFVLAYGDWMRAFVIVDRIGATVEILPGFGANQRPTGQRHLFITSRHGSEIVVPQAARLLDVPTTA